MQQAAVLEGFLLDRFSPFQNGLPTSGIDVGRRQIADALVVSAVVVAATRDGAQITHYRAE